MKTKDVKVIQDMSRYYDPKTGSYTAPPGYLFRMGNCVKVGENYQFETILVKIEK